jgi:hypothetical protein
VLPALPAPRPAGASRPRLLLLGLSAAWALFAASEALALGLTVDPPRESGGYVYCDVWVADPFEVRVRESLARGMPATLGVRAELWRRRNGWFDRLESSFDADVRIRYEFWSEQYRIERAGAEPLRVADLDSAAALLSLPRSLPLARIGQIRPGVRYYVVVSAVLKPLSVEDIEEVEGWLSGEVRSNGRAGLGVVTELPRTLFDAVRNFAGFGDRRTRTMSAQFGLEDLFRGSP